MILKPLGDKLIVRSLMEDRIGLIWVPLASKNEAPVEGTVVAIGEGCASVRPGDTIVFGKYAGTPVADLKNGYMICESDIKYFKIIEESDDKESI